MYAFGSGRRWKERNRPEIDDIGRGRVTRKGEHCWENVGISSLGTMPRNSTAVMKYIKLLKFISRCVRVTGTWVRDVVTQEEEEQEACNLTIVRVPGEYFTVPVTTLQFNRIIVNLSGKYCAHIENFWDL